MQNCVRETIISNTRAHRGRPHARVVIVSCLCFEPSHTHEYTIYKQLKQITNRSLRRRKTAARSGKCGRYDHCFGQGLV